ncbi:MAG: NADH:ubiquinone reductase (Na(+)-transporting) subunit C [Rikenellaceae bacterium]
MAINKNSNVYIITYATVMVVVVAAILATAAMVLKPYQQANIKKEKQVAILSSLGAEQQDYDSFIQALALDAEGEVIESIQGEDVLNLLADLKASQEAGTYPLFVAEDGRVVVPVTGQGLWGPVWGYVALESDKSTISGIVLDHAGETPGLGAEIATVKHQAQYKGKSIFEGDDFVSVTLIKGGTSASSANFNHEVDGISGGTKTADGVSAMLQSSLSAYVPYLKGSVKKCCSGVPSESEESSEENCEENQENIESNE